MKLKKVDGIFLILIIIITVLSIDLFINISHREALENISKYPSFQNLETGLLITFWVCLVGNLLPVPTLYIFVVCFSSLPFLQMNFFVPLLVSFIASLGCLIGEMGGYLVGRGAAKVISDDRMENLKNYQQYLVNLPKLTPFLIFFFGFTPLNDDIITVPLGIIKYDAKKVILFIWLGKLGLMLIFAFNVFNICQLIGGENWIFSILTLYFTIIIVYLMLKIDVAMILKKIRN